MALSPADRAAIAALRQRTDSLMSTFALTPAVSRSPRLYRRSSTARRSASAPTAASVSLRSD